MPTRTRRIAGLVAASILAMVAAGCAASPAPTSGGDVDREAVVHLVSPVEPASLDPTMAASRAFEVVSRAFFDTLVGKAPNDEIDLDAGLLTEVAQVDDTTFRLSVRDGVTFHDGEPWDANAAAFSLTTAMSNVVGNYYQAFQSATAVGEQVVELKTKVAASVDIVSSLMTEIPGLPPTYYAEKGKEFGKSPVGTGAMKFAEWRPGQKIVGERFDDYWRGAPNIAGFEATFNPDGAARLANVASGDAQFTLDIDYSLMGSSPGVTYYNEQGPNMVLLAFNPNAEPVNDPRIRRAIFQAVDSAVIASDLLKGNATEQENVYGPGGGSGVGTVDPNPYDQDAARALVAQVKAERGGTLPPVALQYQLGRYPNADVVGQFVAQAIQDIGLTVDEQPMQQADFITKFIASDGQLSGAFLTATGTWFPKLDYLMQYYAFLAPNSVVPYCSRDFPQYAEMYDKWWAASADPSAQSDIAMATQKEFEVTQACINPLVRLNKTYVTSEKLSGFEPRQDELITWGDLSLSK